MKKLVIAATMLVMMVGQANAWDNRRHNPPPRQYHHQHRGINPWVAGALGLGILGAGSYYYYNNRQCWDEMVGYDVYGREVWQRRCY